MPNFPKWLISLIVAISPMLIMRQYNTIKGKLSNATNAEALPYISLYLVMPDGKKINTTTDFDGFYNTKYSETPDSLVIKNPAFKQLG